MLCLAFVTWKLVRNFWHLPEFTDVYTHYHSEITSVKCNMDSGAFNQKRIEILSFYQTEVWINWTLWHLRLRIFYLFLMNSIFLVSRNTCLCMFIHVYVCLYMFKQKPRISLYSKSLKFSKVSFYPAGPNQNMTFQDLFPLHICLINPVCSWASYTISKCQGGTRTAHSWGTATTNICQREIREIYFYKIQKYSLKIREMCRGLKTTFVKSHSHCIQYPLSVYLASHRSLKFWKTQIFHTERLLREHCLKMSEMCWIFPSIWTFSNFLYFKCEFKADGGLGEL